jgi:hypothetical protein
MRLEQGSVMGTLILTLSTPDGFEVSFGLRADDLMNIQQAAGTGGTIVLGSYFLNN